MPPASMSRPTASKSTTSSGSQPAADPTPALSRLRLGALRSNITRAIIKGSTREEALQLISRRAKLNDAAVRELSDSISSEPLTPEDNIRTFVAQRTPSGKIRQSTRTSRSDENIRSATQRARSSRPTRNANPLSPNLFTQAQTNTVPEHRRGGRLAPTEMLNRMRLTELRIRRRRGEYLNSSRQRELHDLERQFPHL